MFLEKFAKNTVPVICSFFLLIMTVSGQLQLDNTNNSATIDFTTTVPGVNNGAFAGTGFAPAPATGQLDSDAFAITGFSDGNLVFGGTATTGDLARGDSTAGETTGGLYNLNDPASNLNGIIIQPGGSPDNDFNPGTITLRIQNTGTTNITSFNIAYDILVRNDQNRSLFFNFSYSTDGTTYTPIPALDYTSPESSTGLAAFAVPRSTTIGSIMIAPNDYFYIRFSSGDVSGSGSRDEIGVDDIAVTASFAPVTAGEVFLGGRVIDDRGMPIPNAVVIVSGGPLSQPRTTQTSGFGFFLFNNVSVGNTYVVSVMSDNYFFQHPAQVISLDDENMNILFVGTRFFETPSRKR